MKTIFRGFRLPGPIDRSLSAAVKDTGQDRTKILVRILTEAIRNGDLPRPASERDARQLDFLLGLPARSDQ